MLPRPQRLRTKRDFSRLFRQRRTVSGPALTIWAGPNNCAQHRFGFIIGKAVAKKASVRNKIKRRLRHIARELPAGDQTLDLAVKAKPPAVGQNYQQLRQEFTTLYRQLTHVSFHRLSNQPLPGHRLSRPRTGTG